MTKRKNTSIALVLSVMLLLSAVFTGSVSAEGSSKKLTEWFHGTDKTVANSVALMLGVSEDTVVASTQLEQIDTLYVTAEDGVGTVDLSGIELLTNVDRLVLQSNNPVQYINGDKLQQMPVLRELALGHQTIDSTHFVKDLTQITKLELNGGKLQDNVLRALQGNLTDLRLTALEETDISLIDDLRDSLYTLHINYTDTINNFALVENFERLQDLTVMDVALIAPDLMTISRLKNLLHLTLVNNNLRQEDLYIISNQVELQTLYISRNNVTDLMPFQAMTRVENLVLSENSISDISLLADMPQLGWVHLYGNQITDVSPLQDAVNIYSLDIGDNNIKDISSLKNLGNLQNFFFDRNEISDISVLENLTSLQFLSGMYNEIEDVSPLKGLDHLYALYLDNNHIYDISPIQPLLQKVAFSGKEQVILLPEIEKSGKTVSVKNKIVGADGNPIAIHDADIQPGGTYDSAENTVVFDPFEYDMYTAYAFSSADETFTGTVQQGIMKLYTVVFDGQGAVVAQDRVTARYDEKISEPKSPVLDGYDFAGWNTMPDGSGDHWDFANHGVVSDMTLYAQWTEIKLPEDKPADSGENNQTEMNSEKPEADTNTPPAQTGDSNYLLFAGLLFLSGIAGLAVFLKKRKIDSAE